MMLQCRYLQSSVLKELAEALSDSEEREKLKDLLDRACTGEWNPNFSVDDIGDVRPISISAYLKKQYRERGNIATNPKGQI